MTLHGASTLEFHFIFHKYNDELNVSSYDYVMINIQMLFCSTRLAFVHMDDYCCFHSTGKEGDTAHITTVDIMN